MIKSHFFGVIAESYSNLTLLLTDAGGLEQARNFGMTPRLLQLLSNSMLQNSKFDSLMQPTNQVYGSSEPQPLGHSHNMCN